MVVVLRFTDLIAFHRQDGEALLEIRLRVEGLLALMGETLDSVPLLGVH